MKFLIVLVLLTVGILSFSKYFFDSLFKEDIKTFEEALREAHPEYFKAPEAKRLGKSLQNSL